MSAETYTSQILNEATLLATRAHALHAVDDPGFTAVKQSIERLVTTTPLDCDTPHLVLEAVFERLYPVVSLPLLSYAIAHTRPMYRGFPPPQYWKIASELSDDVLDRLIAFGHGATDLALLSNPALPEEHAWRIIARRVRYVRVDGYLETFGNHMEVGAACASSPELASTLIEMRHSELLVGMTRLWRQEGYTPPTAVADRLLAAVMRFGTTDFRYDIGDLATFAAEHASYAALRSIIDDWEHRGQHPHRDEALTAAAGIWKRWMSDDDSLSALIAHPLPSVRRMLLLSPEEYRTLPSEKRKWYRESVLPRLAKDRSPGTRHGAKQLLGA